MSIYGPQLPPGFKSAGGGDAESSASNNTDTDSAQGVYGPAVPPGLIGPVMPSTPRTLIGPVMPPGFNKRASCDDDNDDEEDDGAVIGPSLSEAVGEDYVDDVAADVDRRAMKMKNRIDGKNEGVAEPKRETWMTELPDNLGLRIGLGARTFSKRGVQGDADRSGWTDTPMDRARKAQEKASKKPTEERPLVTDRELERDRELSKQVEEYNRKKRPQSLYEIHKQKKKKTSEKTERKEFNRDEDLKIQRVDRQNAKSLANNAAFLRSKFAAGASKFL